MPLYSVLMPTHNRADVIGFAIRSVLAQTEPDFELLIVGDGCTDSTREVVGSFTDPRIRWFDLPKATGFGYANRNRALREAKGDLVAFAAHDDLLLPDHLETMAASISAARADWIYSRPLWVSTDGVIVPFSVNLNLEDERRIFLNRANSIPANCIVHRRSCFSRFGYWPEDVKSEGDLHLWRRIVSKAPAAYEPLPTSLHFSANWRKSRHAGHPLVDALLQIADTSHWWPRTMKVTVKKDEPEQATFDRLLASKGADWCKRLRDDVDLVIGRLAWEMVNLTMQQHSRAARRPPGTPTHARRS